MKRRAVSLPLLLPWRCWRSPCFGWVRWGPPCLSHWCSSWWLGPTSSSAVGGQEGRLAVAATVTADAGALGQVAAVAATGCLLLSNALEFFSSCCSRSPRFMCYIVILYVIISSSDWTVNVLSTFPFSLHLVSTARYTQVLFLFVQKYRTTPRLKISCTLPQGFCVICKRERNSSYHKTTLEAN
jgi:hypothetical protein